MSENWYPPELKVNPEGTASTYEMLAQIYQPDAYFSYAEFGIYKADTSRHICEKFPNATLFLFDFEDAISTAKEKLSNYGNKIHYFPNSQKYNDSYNWSLMKLIEQNHAPIFDYCFLDGAHTVALDALNFFLCDKLLRPGGHMDFDDYSWRLRGSSLDPSKVSDISLQYTEEQIDAYQVKMIVDLLVKRDDGYSEVIQNKVYRKMP
ncbi:hypothetical protein [Paracoccus sp. SCSIO 75233]|uniref:hypothetical protein n=1 Tax=Paracoccus sp. SCSIO 75233 TaxID=3017782 RepID=UPI0022F0708E|nr:hypothetical protein [Paracoccus sp. SCSIO 75233]WBU53117.1 hypothetical protein PAF12_15070 [Paracoccus sp. SCSIO 75233]